MPPTIPSPTLKMTTVSSPTFVSLSPHQPLMVAVGSMPIPVSNPQPAPASFAPAPYYATNPVQGTYVCANQANPGMTPWYGEQMMMVLPYYGQQQQQQQPQPQTTIPIQQQQQTSLMPVQTSTYQMQMIPAQYTPAPQSTTFTTQQNPAIISPPLPTMTNSANMQIVWHSLFDQLFSNYRSINHFWQLIPSESEPLTGNVHTIKDSAKVRFLCKNCGNAWTSMKGRIVFWVSLDPSIGHGVVCFKLFGQKCEKCSSGQFEHAMWYPEEVKKVVTNVFYRVGETFYGFQKVQILNERRPGKPRTQHNSKLCQACADGVCTEGNSMIDAKANGFLK